MKKIEAQLPTGVVTFPVHTPAQEARVMRLMERVK